MGKPKQTYRCSCKSTLQADTVEQLHEMVKEHFTIEVHHGQPIPELEGLTPKTAIEIIEEHPDSVSIPDVPTVTEPVIERKPFPRGIIERRSHVLKMIARGKAN